MTDVILNKPQFQFRSRDIPCLLSNSLKHIYMRSPQLYKSYILLCVRKYLHAKQIRKKALVGNIALSLRSKLQKCYWLNLVNKPVRIE